MKRRTSCFMFMLITIVLTSSCLYRMPRCDDDLSTVPITNNPNVLGKPNPSLIPATNM